MQTIFRIFDDAQHGRMVVAKLFEAGVTNLLRVGPETLEHPFEHVEEREGSFADHDTTYYDTRKEPEGSFGTTEPRPPDAHQRREGNFADMESPYHNVQSERHGSFADMELSETLAADNLKRALRDLGLSHDEATMCVSQIEQGATVVIVHASGAVAETARDILTGPVGAA